MNRVKRILNSRLANNLLPFVVIVLVALIFSALTKGRFLSKASVNTIINTQKSIFIFSPLPVPCPSSMISQTHRCERRR